MKISNDLKIVVLDSAYDTWESKLTQDLFSAVVGLKLRGYKAEYPYGILPVDSTDFVATHHMVCRQQGGELFPLMAYKSITYEKCLIHNLPFPILGLARALGLDGHARSIERIVERCKRGQLRLSYDSSWTIDPECRKNRELTKTLRSVMTALHSLYHDTAGTSEIISLGSLRFKMDQLFTYWGYKPIALEDRELPQFTVPSYFNEPVLMFHQTGGFSEKSLADAKALHQELWDRRLEIRPADGTESLETREAA